MATTSAWQRVSARARCPICGSDSWCATHPESTNTQTGEARPPFVKCMRRGVGDAPEDTAYRCTGSIKSHEGHNGTAFKWVKAEDIERYGGRKLSPEEREKQRVQWAAEKQRREEQRRRNDERRAKFVGATWGSCEAETYRDHKLLKQSRAAMKKAGEEPPAAIETGELTEGAGIALRYLASRGVDLLAHYGGLLTCLRWHGAAPDVYAPDRREWDGAPAMVAKVVGPKVDTPGATTLRGVHCTYMTVSTETGEILPTKRAGDLGRRKHGRTSGGAVRLREDYGAGVLVVGEGIETTLSAAIGMKKVGITPAAWAALDAPSMEAMELDQAVFGTTFAGEHVAPEARGKIHTLIIAADLDENDVGVTAATVLAERVRAAAPWVTVIVRPPCAVFWPELIEVRDGVAHAKNGKGVDWNDCLQLAIDKGAGVELVGLAMMDGLRLNELLERKARWRPSQKGVAVGTKKPKAKKGKPEEENSDDGGGGDEELVPEQPEDDRTVLTKNPLAQARHFLIAMMSPPDDVGPDGVSSRSGSRFYLTYWNESWFEYVGTHWERLKEVHLAARVQQYLNGCWTWNSKLKIVPFVPTPRAVAQVIESLKTDCAVPPPAPGRDDRVPCWLPATFGSDGAPVWGVAAIPPQHARNLPEAGNIIALRNALMDADEWARGAFVIYPHTPCYFCLSSMPFELPIDDLEAAVNGGEEAILALFERWCPQWLKFLRGVSGEDAWGECLQEWFGYSLVHSTVLEKALLICGPKRTGKGTIRSVWQAVLGKRNVGTTSFALLTEKFHPAKLIGKHLAVMNDASMGKFTDMSQAVEGLKAQISGDPTHCEWKHVKDTPDVEGTWRFVIYCNEIPNMQDASTALADRFVILEMKHSHAAKPDRTLKRRLVKEAQGVMLWALFGLRRLWQSLEAGEGFTLPDSSKEAHEEFSRASSPVFCFYQDCLVFEQGAETAVKDVFGAWGDYSKANGHHPGSSQLLSKRLHSIEPMIETAQRVSVAEPDPGMPADESKKVRTRVFLNVRLVDGLKPALSGTKPSQPPQDLPPY